MDIQNLACIFTLLCIILMPLLSITYIICSILQIRLRKKFLNLEILKNAALIAKNMLNEGEKIINKKDIKENDINS